MVISSAPRLPNEWRELQRWVKGLLELTIRSMCEIGLLRLTGLGGELAAARLVGPSARGMLSEDPRRPVLRERSLESSVATE